MRVFVWVGLILSVLHSGSALANRKFQYFVFPLTDIVGIDSRGQSQPGAGASDEPDGPLINADALDRFLLPPGAPGQRRQGREELISHFTTKLRESYPQATVHPKQVALAQNGNYAFQPNAECGARDVFQAPVKDSYAVALGLTRLSYFENRFDRYVQVFIPVTMSIQFVRPYGLQSAFTKSHTEYFGREFTISEAFGPDGKLNQATTGILRNGAMAAAKRSIDALMAAAKNGFQPKETEVEVIDWSGDYVVLNRGPEVGFVSGQGFEVEGGDYFFEVLRTQRGWTVGRFQGGPKPNLRKGLKLRFDIPSPNGKDDEKPDLMPLVYADKRGFHAAGSPISRTTVADYFSLDIGFSAPFNLTSLNPTLDEIATGIKSDANCGDLNKAYETMPGIGNVSSAKRPTPSYFIVFDVKASMPLTTEFRGSVATNTRETYRLLAAARVIDRNATVFQSVLAEEVVENEISFGRGIGKAQVREVALKNASVRLTQSLLSTLKFTPREYQIVAVAAGRVRLANAAKANVRNGSFFRPLNIRVAGSRVIVPFETSLVSVEAEPQIQPEGNDLWIAVTDPRRTLREGDVFRTSDLTESKEDIKHCGKPVFQIPNNALKVGSTSVAHLTVAHSLVQSARFNLIEPDEFSIEETNQALKRGFFADEIKPKKVAAACYLPAVWVREEASQCERPDRCSSTGGIGAGIVIERNGQMWKRDMVNLRITAPALDPQQKVHFYDLKMLEALRVSSGDLAKKIGGF